MLCNVAAFPLQSLESFFSLGNHFPVEMAFLAVERPLSLAEVSFG